MIPEQLILKNFLSYREATLHFGGLQTACICGANGAGKSSLLEAMAWSIWGKSRASTEDDVIFAGETEATVNFTFRFGHEVYRVIRTRRLGQTTALEFQMAIDEGDPDQWAFRSLTERGARATQAAILQRLRLDYDTFVNSAYLRQGRADEFMLKTPADRKDILADLLKLGQYDDLAEQARERSKLLKGEAKQLEESIQSQEQKLADRTSLTQELATVEQQLKALRGDRQKAEARLEQLRSIAVQRQTQQQQLQWIQQQQQTVCQELERLAQEGQRLAQRQAEIDRTLAAQTEIEAGIQQLQQWQREDEILGQKSQQYHQWTTEQNQRQQALDREVNRLENEQRTLHSRLQDLAQQEQELQSILNQRSEVESAATQWQTARHHLNQLEQMQTQAAPLVQRRQQLLQEGDRVRSRLVARLEELQNLQQRAMASVARRPQLIQQWEQIDQRIQALENRKVYQDRVQEKGTERKGFIDRLTGMRVDLENQLAKLTEKMTLLAEQPAIQKSQNQEIREISEDYGACPLCDQPLDQHHLERVQAKQKLEETELRDRLWVLQEQLALTEREIQILRQEYRDLKQELQPLNSLIEERGKLQEQLQTLEQEQISLAAQEATIAQLTATLDWFDRGGAVPEPLPELGRSLPDLRHELAELDDRLTALNFDDRNLALARAEVDRWRWVELKQHELNQAQRKLEQLQQRRPALLAERDQLQKTLASHLDAAEPTSLTAQLALIKKQLTTLNYQPDHHEQVRAKLRSAQGWLARAETLRQCQQEAPQLLDRQRQLAQAQQSQTETQNQLAKQWAEVQSQLTNQPDPSQDLQQLDAQLNDLQRAIESTVAKQAQLSQQQEFLQQLAEQIGRDRQQLQQKHHQQRVYDELTKAFGKNGIQALAIETLLPQLEAEANRILSQLSANQLHINFVTQRLKKTATKRQKATDLASATIETLEIQIADAQGTRPYETYSGGESFRINFAIRLALSRLLAQRSGTALQLLIIDEGFGTQDDAGRDRLVAAINAIAPDFGCILTVTHIPQLKEAFTARIEVQKTAEGSKLAVFL